jgi:N6-adenosine-specific RNA methylase IME4
VKYGVILADPPWSYQDHCNSGKRGSCHKYAVMTLSEVMALGPMVQDLAATDCVLFLWVPPPLVALGVVDDVMKSWGFEPKTQAFVWVKTTPSRPLQVGGINLAMGMGHWTRANAEGCYLGIRGRPKRVSAAVHSVVFADRREHSRKPDEVYRRIEQLMGDVPKIELFARQRVTNWDTWGDETSKFGEVTLSPQVAAE